MQTRDLTWSQAENLLRTGLAKFIEFQNSDWENCYYVRDGIIYGKFRSVREVPSPSREFGNYEPYRFKVVDKPTSAIGIDL